MKVFECKKCGHCCEGRGGIVLSSEDLARLATFLGISASEFIDSYAEVANGKLRVRTGENGFCVFFRAGQGCGVHAGKPDICRAWPFFRGNLEDEASLNLAREFCPGIDPKVDFVDFARQGTAYLVENNLIASDGINAANSLVIKTANPGRGE